MCIGETGAISDGFRKNAVTFYGINLSWNQHVFHVRNTPQLGCRRKTAATSKPRDQLNFEQRTKIEK